jgi:hypothetical protein
MLLVFVVLDVHPVESNFRGCGQSTKKPRIPQRRSVYQHVMLSHLPTVNGKLRQLFYKGIIVKYLLTIGTNKKKTKLTKFYRLCLWKIIWRSVGLGHLKWSREATIKQISDTLPDESLNWAHPQLLETLTSADQYNQTSPTRVWDCTLNLSSVTA